MPRRGKHGKARERIEVISGSEMVTLLSASTSGQVNITPAVFTRSAAIADNFNLYRFTKLRIHFLGNSVGMAVGYSPGILDTPPSTLTQVINVERSAYNFFEQTTPTTLSIDKSVLLRDGAAKWWKAVASAAVEGWDEIQGQVYCAATTTTTQFVWFEYTVEFTAWALAANTPKPVQPTWTNSSSATDPPEKQVSGRLPVAPGFVPLMSPGVPFREYGSPSTVVGPRTPGSAGPPTGCPAGSCVCRTACGRIHEQSVSSPCQE